ncbi:MAG: EF-P beta-lysylation protein EpmB [Ostreibacterium sp.]
MVNPSAWQRILADSYTQPQALLNDLGLPDYDVSANSLFSTRVPKPFVAKMQHGNPNDPLLLQVLPQAKEFENIIGFSTDPLAEQQFNPLPGLLHKYPSRVLLTLRGACAINCRYCFRRHFNYVDNRINDKALERILDYIKQYPKINEIVLSGGDPLMAKDKLLRRLIERFATIPQLKRLRFHTRLPVVIPERITDELAEMLAKTHLQTIVVVHSNHPNEIDNNFAYHVEKLSTSGTQVLNQSVLLKGINDSAEILAQLSEKLYEVRVLPYYLFLLDKVSGTAHFEVDETTAKQLIQEVAGLLPGYLVPKLARETPQLSSKDMWV